MAQDVKAVRATKKRPYVIFQVGWGFDRGSEVYRAFSIVYSIQTILSIALNRK